MPQVVTIPEAVRRAKADGLPIADCALRRLVRTGAIPARKVGRKALLFYPNLLSYLRCEDGCDNAPATVATGSGIRRVDWE